MLRLFFVLFSVSLLGNVWGKDPEPKVYSLRVKSDIRYRYATTLVTSRVVNPANVSQEVTFNVVLPETAFITGFVMAIDGKEYKAYVKEKEEAKKEYEQALESGLSAAHVSYNARDSNNFDVAVNIEPLKKVTFNLTYEEFLERKLSRYNHEININPGQIVPDMSVEVNIQDASPIINLQVPDIRTKNEVVENEIDNPNVVIKNESPEKVSIKWTLTEDEQRKKNKDGIKGQLAVKYDVDRSKNPQQILVDEGYFVHFYSEDGLKPLNKHVVFVLDLSGSMMGRKLEQLKEAMNQILAELRSKDYFSLVFFSDVSKAWVPNKPFSFTYAANREPEQELSAEYVVPVTEENINNAITLIQNLTDLGGTNIISGLRKGLKLVTIGKDLFKNSADGLEPLVIFLTDGQANVEMSNSEEISKTTTALNTFRSPVFSLGFGDGADMDFLKKLSLNNSGLARTIYEASDAALQLKLFYSQVASPLLSNVTFNYVPGQVGNETTKVHFDTLFSGGELVVAGELESDTIEGALLAHSSAGTKELPFKDVHIIRIRDFLPPIPRETNKTFGHLERMWAYKTIKQLLDNNTLTNDPEPKKKALELALKYSFVTPVTSLVVVKPNKTSTVDAEKASNRVPAYGIYGFAAGPGQYGIQSSAGLMHTRTYMMKGPLRVSAASLSGIPPLAYRPMALPAAGYPGPPAPPQHPYTHLTTTFRPWTSTDISTTQKFDYHLIDYTDVSWLNLTATDGDTNLIFPLDATADLISLNATDTAYDECTAEGETGHCRHFIHCSLDVFQYDPVRFNTFKCHIDPEYVGVCCPTRVKPVQPPVP